MLTAQEVLQFYGPEPSLRPMTAKELATVATADLFNELERRLSTIKQEINPLPQDIALIIKAVTYNYRVTETQIFSRSRVRRIAWARAAALTCINAAGYSLHATADVFGMDHTSVISARKRVQELRNINRLFGELFAATMDDISRGDQIPAARRD